MSAWAAVHVSEFHWASPALSQAVVINGTPRQLWISGQVGFDSEGVIVGIDDPKRQAEAALENIGRVLAAVNADWRNVAVMRIFATSLGALQAVREVRERFLTQPRPAATGIVVSGLVDPRLLVEIEAMAVLE
jgi:enamine deaminase RidA (YjgF/YER057c/UK114 family)